MFFYYNVIVVNKNYFCVDGIIKKEESIAFQPVFPGARVCNSEKDDILRLTARASTER